MPGIKKTALQSMVETFDQLVYMVKTTAPHLQGITNELRDKIKLALDEAKGVPAKTVTSAPAAPVVSAKPPLIPHPSEIKK